MSTRIVLAVDEDDPELDGYASATRFARYGPETVLMVLRMEETGNLTRASNTASLRIAAEDPDAIIGNLGDDQIARTPGWDKMVAGAMTEPGFVHGNDLFQREALPCGGIFIHASIVAALGWYALPVCEHLFIDNAWGDLGRGIGRLTYLPDMVFEHVHPFAGKAEWDEGYERANNREIVDRDRTAYETWRETWLESDIANIRSAMNVRAGLLADYSGARARAE